MNKILSVFILIYICPSFIFALEWNALRGDRKGQASITYAGTKNIPEWHYTYKSNRRYEQSLAVWASPAIALIGGNPMAFIGGYDQTMHALDLLEKRVMWRKITNGVIAAAPVISKINGRDVVFFGSNDRTVYAVSAFSGKQIWTKELVPASTTLGKVSVSSPFISEEKLYISCFAYDKSLARNEQKGLLFCLDKNTGKIIWKIVVTTGFLSSPVGFEFQDQEYITIAARRGIVQCFRLTNNKPQKVWNFQMPHEVLGSPVITTNQELKFPMLFIGSKYGSVIALNALTGEKTWDYMTGHWIDNTCCIANLDGTEVVYFGSHDYNVYALNAQDGKPIWRKHLGGEIYSAPCFFHVNKDPYIVVASLDNHLYVLNAKTGHIITSLFTGQPIWDRVSKGDTLWGSPAAISAGSNTSIVHGSYNDIVFTLPFLKECTVTAMARSSKSLGISLFVVFVVFLGIVLPIIIYPKKYEK